MAKYRGDQNDWLDDQSHRGAKPKKKGNAQRSLSADQATATVAEVFPNQCRIRWDSGQETPATYRRAAVLERGATGPRERAPVAVGDRVKAERSGDTGIVAGVAERRNRLIRPAPDHADTLIHVIVANLDALAIVTATLNPDFSPGLVDRFMVAASAQGIPVILCVNKIDLWQPGTESPLWHLYRDLGTEVHEVCAKSGTGIETLHQALRGKTVAFCGHSGVGKTSLLRKLLGTQFGQIGDVSDFTGKGRHTTSSAVLLPGPEGTQWIDTPGVREFGLIDISPETLRDHFPEFTESRASCTPKACLHLNEEGCAVRGFPRYTSYRRILESLQAGEH